MEIDNLKQQLAKTVKETRKEAGLSVKELAKKMGCSPSYIRMVESGQQTFSLNKMSDFARALGKDIFISFPEKENTSELIKKIEQQATTVVNLIDEIGIENFEKEEQKELSNQLGKMIDMINKKVQKYESER